MKHLAFEYWRTEFLGYFFKLSTNQSIVADTEEKLIRCLSFTCSLCLMHCWGSTVDPYASCLDAERADFKETGS